MGGLKFEEGKIYHMPLEEPRLINEPAIYNDVTTLAVIGKTEREKLEPLIPEPYEIGGEGIISVFFQCCKNVDWLGGRGYNLAGVNVPATYRGKKDTISGNYCLVLWENMAEPIIAGREGLGVPKVFANIPDPVKVESDWFAYAERFGLVFLELEIKGVQPTDLSVISEGLKVPFLGYKYIPSIDGRGADINYATHVYQNQVAREAWVGSGTFKFRKTSEKLDRVQCSLINSLAGLEVKEFLYATISRGSNTLGAYENGIPVGGKKLE